MLFVTGVANLQLRGLLRPEVMGALRGPLRSPWKHRVGDHRISADLRDEELVVLIVRFGHRSTIYRR